MPLLNSWTMRGGGGGIRLRAAPAANPPWQRGERSFSWRPSFRFYERAKTFLIPKTSRQCQRRLKPFVRLLELNGDNSARQTVAVRIIDLAKAGERNPNRLRDRVLHEAAMASRVDLDGE